MRKLLSSVLATFGIGLVVCGIALFNTGVPVVQAQNTDAEYIGLRQCSDCHRDIRNLHRDSPHALALQDVKSDKTPILADFSQGDDLRMVTFPGESAPRPFTADDVTLVVGAGRYFQRYVYKTDNGYMVLPAEWNTTEQAWQPYKLADNWPDAAYDFVQNCAGCHTTGLNVDRGRWQDDGVQCEACHGPGSNHADAADNAGGDISDEEMQQIRDNIILSPDPQVCGQCHSQGAAPDGHPYPVDYLPGGTLLDPNVFTLVAPDDPAHWWPTGQAHSQNMQFNEWMNSAHATSLDTMRSSDKASSECLTCHSGDYRFTQQLNGEIQSGDRPGPAFDEITLDNAQYGVTCVTCHSPHSKDARPDDLIDDSYALCTSCHQNPDQTGSYIHHPSREMFEGDALVSGVDPVPGVHFSAENGPICATCHMADVPVGENGADGARATHSLVPPLPTDAGDGPPAVCSTCHTDLSNTDIAFLVNDTRTAIRDQLASEFARVGSVQEPETGTAAHDVYQRALDMIAFVQGDGSLGFHNYAYASALLKAADAALVSLVEPEATVEPTEGPAPTATSASPDVLPIPPSAEVAPSGVRPMTLIIIVLVLLFLLGAFVAFFRKSGGQEGNRS